MRLYLLDTNALGHFINHRRGVAVKVREARLRGDRIGTCGPVIGELYYGLELSASRDENVKRANLALKKLKIWPFTWDVGVEFGRIRAEQTRIGRPMQIVDMQVAAVSFVLGNSTVVSSD